MVHGSNCRPLDTLVKVMSQVQEEEVGANGMKIIRICLKEETCHEKVAQIMPDLINQLAIEIFPRFLNSTFINAEMKNILSLYSRKKEFIYLIKPEAVLALYKHPSSLLNHFPIIEQHVQSIAARPAIL
jgi:hypothetical protein